MKHLILLLSLLLIGCETIEHEDGTRTTRFDAEGFAAGTKTLLDTYERSERIRYPDRYVNPPGAPFPIYPPQQ